MCRILAEEGVTTVFGYPGGAILPFYDALRQSTIQHILTAHEQGATHAADGFARASGKVGVCIATSGPGATNLVTGLATAFLDSVPVVAITGQVNRALIGHDTFQEVDITGITMPITKHNFLVKKPENLAQTLRLAFQLAREGRPGPVLVDVPRDVQTALIDFEESRLAELQPLEPDAERVAAAAAAINKAKRPVMLVGGGVINANAEYDAMHLCEKLHIPVVSTLMGLGAISAYRQLFLGMTGLHGHERANNAVKEADLILAVGSRFNDRVTGERSSYSANKLIIHLDIDPAEVDKNIDSGIGITGDMVATLNALEKAAQHLKIQFARQWLTSGGLGTMGFGLPAALGAQLARPQSRVISISGDGGFKMTGSELFTIASNNVPVIAIVFNNSGLGMIRQLQTVQFAKRFTACELPGYVDFVKYAAAFGIEGEHADTPEALAQAVAKAWECRKPYLIEVCINPKNMVLPMVAPGLGINDFVKFADDEIN